jgi:hypothetical protein
VSWHPFRIARPRGRKPTVIDFAVALQVMAALFLPLLEGDCDMQNIFTITGETTLMADITRLAKAEGARVSEPEPLNLDGALNAGLTLEEVRQGVEVLTVLFKAGIAGVAFLTALRAYLRGKLSSAKVTIGDGSGQVRGQLDTSTTDDQIEELAR